jgi:hypothetical protein
VLGLEYLGRVFFGRRSNMWLYPGTMRAAGSSLALTKEHG